MIHFFKMHGLGNDFMVIDNRALQIDPSTLPVAHLSHRHTGVGFDQLLLIEPSKQADFFCRIYNADGSEASQCGNGLRAIARLLQHEKICLKPQLTLETKAGFFQVTIQANGQSTVAMGKPVIRPCEWVLPSMLQATHASVVSLGNEHLIVLVQDVKTLPVDALHACNRLVQDQMNIGFMQILDAHRILLRTFERGVGETCACGSNATAAVAAGIQAGLLANSVTVCYPYGTLQVAWPDLSATIFLTGDATFVFKGSLCHAP